MDGQINSVNTHRGRHDSPPMTFPEDVLDLHEDKRIWWVAHTKSRREKALAASLRREHVGYFLPLVEKHYRSKGRTRWSVIPLFSGYVFFRGARIERYEALKTGHIARVIEVAEQERLIRELRQIERVVLMDAPLEPFPFVKLGERVRIVDGPFKGLEGIIERRKGSDRLILSVDVINQAVGLEIDADRVEPVP